MGEIGVEVGMGLRDSGYQGVRLGRVWTWGFGPDSELNGGEKITRSGEER